MERWQQKFVVSWKRDVPENVMHKKRLSPLQIPAVRKSFFLFFLWIYWGFFGLWTDWHYEVAAHTAYYKLGMQHSRLHCSWGEIEAAGSWMNTTSQTWSEFSSSGGSTDQGKKICSRSFKTVFKNTLTATSKSVGHRFEFTCQFLPLGFMLSL